ncbi:MAG: glycosyltransferase family 4 protein [Gammaproteobacteria bacterium]|nr:glycosyltransferase family 4 protein [Gammaproteobacteria bacterium]
MKILIVSSTDTSFNSIRPEGEIFIGMAKRGHKVTIVTQGDTQYAQRYRDNNIKVIDHHPTKKISLKSIGIIRKELLSDNYDIVYATNSKAIPNAAFACIGLNVKFITYRGTTGGLYRHDPSAYLTHLHPRVDGIVCVAEAVREDMVRRVWKNRENVVTIHKGHDLSWYNKAPADLSEFGITSNDFTVICAVNARPSKGITVMLDAANYLADLNNLHILLVGKNMDCEPYTTMIANSSMRERIHLAGFRHDAPELIVASNLLVQPSISGEGLPRAVMEAMGYSTPPIITTTGGGKEVVEDGVTGFIVPIKDPRAIADRIRLLHQQPELLSEMAKNCRQKLATDLSSQRSIDKYLDYFESLLQS